MKQHPLVSVITPAYNAELYIGESIESILKQTLTNFEYIIVDDHSTDNTWDIIQKYARDDSRIIPVKNIKNLGIAGNRNKGIHLAQGKYIAWQDADDISTPRRLEKQVGLMEKNSKVGICGGFLQFFDENGKIAIRRYYPDDASLRKNIFKFSPLSQGGAVLRKKCFDELGVYDLSIAPAEDLEMSFRIGSRYEFANIQEIVLRYREHGNSGTFQKLRTIEINTIKTRVKYRKGMGYSFTIADAVYNLLQYVSIFIIPPKIKIAIFNRIRNSK